MNDWWWLILGALLGAVMVLWSTRKDRALLFDAWAENERLRAAIRHHRNAYEFRHIAVTDPMDAYHLQLWAHVDPDAADALAALSIDPDQQGT